MNKENLNKVLESHKKWILNNDEGERADLIDADLRDAVIDKNTGITLSLTDDPIRYHLESLAFKLDAAMKDDSMLAEITEEELEILNLEVKSNKDAKEWSKNNDKPF